jgi:hypothetical protein
MVQPIDGLMSRQEPWRKSIQLPNADRDQQDPFLHQRLGVQLSQAKIVTGASTLIMSGQTDDGEGDRGKSLTDQRATFPPEHRSIGWIIVIVQPNQLSCID